MEELEKKPRGRPKKEEKISKNEAKEQIIFSKQNEPVTVDMAAEAWQRFMARMPLVPENVLARITKNSWKNNPFLQNNRLKQVLSSPHGMEKENLDEALRDPYNSEQPLREQSTYLYFSNYIYMTLLHLNRDVPEYKWYVLPNFLEDPVPKHVQPEMEFIEKVLQCMNVPLEFKTIATQVSLEGKCSYFPRISWDEKTKKVKYFVLQKLPSNYVKYTRFGSRQTLVPSLDLSMFLDPINSLDYYPPIIRETWEALTETGIIAPMSQDLTRKNLKKIEVVNSSDIIELSEKSWSYWVELDQADVWTFAQDLAHVAAIPETASLFSSFKELDNYKWLMGSLLSKGVDSILTAEIPIKKEANSGTDPTLISPDIIRYFIDLFSSSVNANVYPFFAPFTKFDLHSVETDPAVMNLVNNSIRDIIATSGNGALLPLTDKPSIAAIKTAQRLAASKADYLTRQFEGFLNKYLPDALDLKGEYKVHLWSDIFNTDEIFRSAKELCTAGNHSMLPIVLSKFDQTIHEARSAQLYLEHLGIQLKYLEVLTDEDNNLLGAQGVIRTGRPGRPRKVESEIENDDTADSLEGGDNVTENKS